MKRIDTHLHLWDLQQFPYSWCAGIPALNRSFLISDYLAAIQGTGIEKALFMECDVDEPHSLAEAQHIESLSATHPLIAGLVAATRPERADFPAQLEALLSLKKLRGLRRVLHVVPDATSQSSLFVENLRRLAAHRLTFDLCVQARQLPLALALIRQCPDVQFVLDHCGGPDLAGKAFQPWQNDLRALTELPNVACKISGIMAHTQPGWTTEDLRPWVETCLDLFGWDRVLWGGDWPVCLLGGSLKRWADTTDELLAGASPEEQDKLLYKNAEKIYHL